MVFSSARYPGGDHGTYQDMFSTDNLNRQMSPSPEKHKISEKVQEFNVKNLQSKLQFYSFQARQGEEERTGLGPLPGGLVSASSLAVYNTALCPYTDPDPSLPARTNTRKKSEAVQPAVEETENLSALQGGSQEQAGQGGLLYFPEMGDLPDFDLPDDLELPNIASDLQVRQRSAGSHF